MERVLALGLSLAIGGWACGGDDDGGGPGPLGGVAAGERIVDLNPTQLRDVCQAAQAHARDVAGDDFQRGSCLLNAAFSASFDEIFGGSSDLEQVCGADFEACLSAPSDEAGSDCDLTQPQATCDATVGDYRRCIGYVGQALHVIAGYSCEQVVNDEVPEMPDGGLGTDVRACNDLLEPCLNSVGEGEDIPGDGTTTESVDAGADAGP